MTAERIQSAIQQLLEATPAGERGGFVIFRGNHQHEFVQFALDPNGLYFNWPTVHRSGPEYLPKFRDELVKHGFRELSPAAEGPALYHQLAELQVGETLVLDDGLYAQSGRDVVRNANLAIALLRDVFGLTDLERITITLEPHG